MGEITHFLQKALPQFLPMTNKAEFLHLGARFRLPNTGF
jgi:hypothetical protein